MKSLAKYTEKKNQIEIDENFCFINFNAWQKKKNSIMFNFSIIIFPRFKAPQTAAALISKYY